jgi:hypothetical protein
MPIFWSHDVYSVRVEIDVLLLLIARTKADSRSLCQFLQVMMLIPYAQKFMYFHCQDQGGVGVNSWES